MSMINCPECNKEISNQAKVCPNCGMPVYRMKSNLLETKADKKPKANILSITAIGISIIALIMSFGSGVYAMGESLDDEYYDYCEEYCDECGEYCDECLERNCAYDDCECKHSTKEAKRKSEKENSKKQAEDGKSKETEAMADEETTSAGDESTALDSDEFENKVVLINFWATWCGFCTEEMPDLQKLYDEYKDNENVEIIAINVGESEKKAQLFMDSNKYTIPLEFDSDSELFGELGVDALPYTVVINKDGEIAQVFDGATDYDSMKKAIDKEL